MANNRWKPPIRIEDVELGMRVFKSRGCSTWSSSQPIPKSVVEQLKRKGYDVHEFKRGKGVRQYIKLENDSE